VPRGLSLLQLCLSFGKRKVILFIYIYLYSFIDEVFHFQNERLGDQLMSWDGSDGMRTVVTGALGSGLVGHSLQHSDIGGYNAVLDSGPAMYYDRTYEMLKRWCELSAFGSALYRTHPGNQYLRTPQIYDNTDMMSFFGKFAAIFGNLSDYRMSLMVEASQYGYPLMRPLFLHYAFDPQCWRVQDEYLFGEEFLVAPILDPGESSGYFY
jgi:alpha-glucosidase